MEKFYFGRKDDSVICAMYFTKDKHFVCFGMDENKRKLEFELKNPTATMLWKQMNEKFLEKDKNIKGVGVNLIFFKYNKDNELSLNVYANRIDEQGNNCCRTAFYKVLQNENDFNKFSFVTQKTEKQSEMEKFARLYDEVDYMLSDSQLNWKPITPGEQQFLNDIKEYSEQMTEQSLDK